jgi:hypothetical protein
MAVIWGVYIKLLITCAVLYYMLEKDEEIIKILDL